MAIYIAIGRGATAPAVVVTPPTPDAMPKPSFFIVHVVDIPPRPAAKGTLPVTAPLHATDSGRLPS